MEQGFPIFRNYLEDEDDKPYFTVNSLAYYYEDMERKQKLITDMSKLLLGYDNKLNVNLEEMEKRIAAELGKWDGKVEELPETVNGLLTSWTEDGTLSSVIDSSIVDEKLAPLTAQLAETASKVGKVGAFPQRPMYSEGDRVVNVPADYPTIQAAVNSIPFYLSHTFTLNIAPGVYDEDIIINSVISTGQGRKTQNNIEGAVQLRITGDIATPSNVQVGSIFITGCLGVASPHVEGMKLMRNSPYFNEACAFGVFGGGQSSLRYAEFGDGVTNGLMAYSANIKALNIDFGINKPKVAVIAKRGSNIMCEWNKGAVEQYIQIQDVGLVTLRGTDHPTGILQNGEGVIVTDPSITQYASIPGNVLHSSRPLRLWHPVPAQGSSVGIHMGGGDYRNGIRYAGISTLFDKTTSGQETGTTRFYNTINGIYGITFQTTAGGNLEIMKNDGGIVTKSADGKRWLVTVGNDGVLKTTLIT